MFSLFFSVFILCIFVATFLKIGTVPIATPPVRVKGGMSLRNGMWHGLRNGIIMRNLIYADRFQRNKLN